MLAIVLFCMPGAACSHDTKDIGNGSNTSWFQGCVDASDCGEAGICVNGVCTMECSATADCLPLATDSQCADGVRPALSRDDTCDDVRVLDVCVPGCETTRDCSHVGTGFTCDGTRCLPEPCTAVQAPDDVASGGGGGTPANHGGQVQGDGGQQGGTGGPAAGAGGGASAPGGAGGAGTTGGVAGAAVGGTLAAGGAAGAAGAVQGGIAGMAGGAAGSAGSGGSLPIVGSWHEEARIDCTTGAEVPADPAPINEIVFSDAGSFSVTWTPFEWYADYEGTYVLDSEAGTLEMTVINSNYLPTDTDLAGSYSIDDNGELILQGIWFGTDTDATATTACGHRLARNPVL